jgi:hypothetical protein
MKGKRGRRENESEKKGKERKEKEETYKIHRDEIKGDNLRFSLNEHWTNGSD